MKSSGSSVTPSEARIACRKAVAAVRRHHVVAADDDHAAKLGPQCVADACSASAPGDSSSSACPAERIAASAWRLSASPTLAASRSGVGDEQQLGQRTAAGEREVTRGRRARGLARIDLDRDHHAPHAGRDSRHDLDRLVVRPRPAPSAPSPPPRVRVERVRPRVVDLAARDRDRVAGPERDRAQPVAVGPHPLHAVCARRRGPSARRGADGASSPRRRRCRAAVSRRGRRG